MNNIGTIEDGSMKVIVEMKEAGPKGDDGYTPVKGVDYFDGEKGPKGDDGLTTAVKVGSTQYNHIDGVVSLPAYPTALPADGGDADTVNGKTVGTNVPSDAKFTDTITTINGKTGAISKDDITALGIPEQDTIYNHPSIHPASMITESTTKRFVSDTKISEWDGKETTTGSQDKANQAEQNAKDYTDQEISSIDIPDSTWENIQNKPDTFAPSEHIHSIGSVTGLQNELNSKETPSGAQSKANVAESNAKDYVDGKVKTDVPIGAKFTDTIVDISGKADKSYVDSELAVKVDDSRVLTDVPANAKFTDTIYSHPSSHPASMITGLPTSLPADGGNADTVGGFTVGMDVPADAVFTDTDTVTTINGKTGAISKADIVALGIPSQDTNTTYSEITTAEIDTGTASTLRTITARRLKYLLDKIVALFPTKTSELTNDSGFLTSVTKSDVGLSNVDNVKQMPISGGVLENYREKLVTLSGTFATGIYLSNGNVFTHSLTGDTSYRIYDAVSGQAHSFTLIITQTATVRPVTFPESVKWQGGEIPDLSTANKTYILTFMTVDGGTTWLGMFGGEF